MKKVSRSPSKASWFKVPWLRLPSGDAGSSSKSSTAMDRDFNETLLKRLPDLLKNAVVRKAFCDLKRDEAQLVIDYLDSTLQQSIAAGLRKDVVHTLYGMCRAYLLYPRCYVLKDVDFGTHVTGGGFSDIYRGRAGQQPLCLKVVRLFQKSESEALLKMYAKEAILWGNAHHPNIVPFYGIFFRDEAQKQVCLISPWFSNGNLMEYLGNNPSKPRLPFIKDISLGLEYLHNQNCVHGDLKGLNVLVDEFGRACLTDFGLSSIRSDDSVAQSMATSTAQGTTYRWAAPELIESDSAHSSKASDVWAFGCVCYETMTGKLPFYWLSHMPTIRAILDGKHPGDIDDVGKAEGGNITVRRIVMDCWSKDPKHRPECKEIVIRLGATLRREKGDEDKNNVEMQFIRDTMRSKGESLDFQKVAQVLNRIESVSKDKGKSPSSPRLNPKHPEQNTDGNAGEKTNREEVPGKGSLDVPAGSQRQRPASYHESGSTDPSSSLLAVPQQEPEYPRRHSFDASNRVEPELEPGNRQLPATRPRSKSGGENQFVFHPLLDRYAPKKSLMFNLSTPQFSAVKYLGPGRTERISRAELTEPASWPVLSYLRIECDLIPQWPLSLEPNPGYFPRKNLCPGDRIPISLGDILVGLHEHLTTDITSEEWKALSPQDQVAVAQSYTKRCKDMGLGEQIERIQGVKRLDYCFGKVWFRGLTRAGDKTDVWKLYLDKP
ncbi:hypothetical protein D9756_006791 [Leucocoprinus leucothites]|uniref:Protein kinase domain-containing protein n=1 Tax=Leucocoprinus leucothites TaxID=201217 RepID=A0A8H5LHB1_9AGAR|nr:hypothetical protein D9756_006791 [Leucoagaricus leucothites]